MLYTISIKNLNGLNKVGQNLIDFNQVSPISVSSPETPYDSFISDTRYNLDGFVQIPLYNRQQYCNIPPNSILTITTENSTEAIYYSTIKIDGGSVTVDPDPVSGKGSGGGGGTDEFAKLLLSRNFENNTLVIPDYITELGPGAINLGYNLSAVKLNPDNISAVSPKAFDFGIQTASYIDDFMINIDESCSYAICPILDMGEVSSMDKMSGIVQSYFSVTQMQSIIKMPVLPLFIASARVFAPFISELEPSSFFDINLLKRAIFLGEFIYCTIELDRDEMPENILFMNYDEQTGEIQNNLFTPDLNYIKGKSFVFPRTLEEFPSSAIQYLDLENLPDDFADYDCILIDSEEMLSEEKNDMFSGGTTHLIYKTDIVKDGKNLFIMSPVELLNRKIETYQSLSLPLLTLKYLENRWYALEQKEEPTP